MILLVIDVQEGITDNRLFDFENFVCNCQKLISAARKSGSEVIYVQHDDGPGTGFSVGDEEFQVSDLVKPDDEEKRYIKVQNSCFSNRELEKYLMETGDKELVIIGLQTDFCIDASVKGALDRGYKVYVPKGANSTFDNEYLDKGTVYKYFNELIWPMQSADCITVEELIEKFEGK